MHIIPSDGPDVDDVPITHHLAACTAHDDATGCATAIAEPAPGVHTWVRDYGHGPQIILLTPINGAVLSTGQALALVRELLDATGLMGGTR